MNWIDAAARDAQQRDRGFLASPFATEVARLDAVEGPERRAAFVRDTLRALIEIQRPRIAGLTLPAAVKALVEKEYVRIERSLQKAPDTSFDLKIHSMRCDFRIVGFGRIPVGVEHIELGGVPRRLLWSGGGRQALRVGRVLLRSGGAAPFYSAHLTHGIKPWAFLMAYNSDTLTAWHRNVAECLKLNPSVRGLIASSWWYDPELVRVAPHLRFLREGSLAHGAILATAGPTRGSAAFAIANSPERERMVAAGTYKPKGYSVVFSRQALISWADTG